jgi:hypothetical protein
MFQCSIDCQSSCVYLVRIGSPAEYKDKLRQVAEAAKKDANAYVEEIKVDKAANTIHRKVLIHGEAKKDSGDIKMGCEHDAHAADGRAAKVWSCP